MMTDDMEKAADTLRAIRPNLPHGIVIYVDKRTDNILVGNEDLAFCVTRKAVERGMHLHQFKPTLDKLIALLDSPNSEDRGVVRSTAELVKQGETTRFS